ncbi:MAG: T9SS type A sorting domain-containing protein [Calditrichaeota bacterium]|nr:T9SS type A sorting domain-containing protein [Calditrichota bacterium]MCB9474743.1 T9SS type A sorting domain-containing protein [Candidatus Delongbacteria bacterium]
MTRVPITLRGDDRVLAELYNLRGARVRIIWDGELPAGNHELIVNDTDLATGVYFIRVVAGIGAPQTAKMVVMK